MTNPEYHMVYFVHESKFVGALGILISGKRPFEYLGGAQDGSHALRLEARVWQYLQPLLPESNISDVLEKELQDL